MERRYGRGGAQRNSSGGMGIDPGLSAPRERSVHRLPGASARGGYRDAGNRRIGKPEGFVERQVRGWAERWQRAKTTEIPEMDRVIEWLRDAYRRRLRPPWCITISNSTM